MEAAILSMIGFCIILLGVVIYGIREILLYIEKIEIMIANEEPKEDKYREWKTENGLYTKKGG